MTKSQIEAASKEYWKTLSKFDEKAKDASEFIQDSYIEGAQFVLTSLSEKDTELKKYQRLYKNTAEMRSNFAIRNHALVECLKTIRNDSSLWKVANISGCDKYHGLPPAMRVIDETLSKLNQSDRSE